jgi:steroid delta-isomerase-like uncharacterized protein
LRYGRLMPISDELREQRLAVVREHMESENEHQFDVTLATFGHPRYELIATAEVFDGPEEVAEYYRRTRAIFPDQRNENTVLHASEDSVIAEFDLLGTHEGELRGVPGTGRTFRCRMCAIFEFAPGTDRIVCERVYFDQMTIAQQLLGEGVPADLG